MNCRSMGRLDQELIIQVHSLFTEISSQFSGTTGRISMELESSMNRGELVVVRVTSGYLIESFEH